jgi:hypothetical protein
MHMSKLMKQPAAMVSAFLDGERDVRAGAILSTFLPH